MVTRNTIQKLTILEYLQSVKTHPTAEGVYVQIKKRIPTITLATVYRNLNLMAEKGKIVRLEINKQFHYDADLSEHHHFICNMCNTISDVFNKNVQFQILKKSPDDLFQVSSVDIFFKGICNTCRNGCN